MHTLTELQPAACAPCADPRIVELLNLSDAFVAAISDVIVDNLHVMGAPAPGRLRFCRAPEGGTTACESGFREDRQLGVIYGTTVEGVWLPIALAGVGRCSYCSAHVPTNAARRARAERPSRKVIR